MIINRDEMLKTTDAQQFISSQWLRVLSLYHLVSKWGKLATIFKYPVDILTSTVLLTYEKRCELDTAPQNQQPINSNSKNFWRMGSKVGNKTEQQ